MEFQDVVRRRRMVRRYLPHRPVPPAVVDRMLHNAQRAPSAGFSQGWGFLVLDTAEDIARFRAVGTPAEGGENWFSSQVQAPLLIVPMSNKSVYLDRYAQPDKGYSDRSDAWWPAPYWDIDAGMAALLILQTAVDEGLGACFFGLPAECITGFRAEFGVPVEYQPVGVVSVGYPDEPPRSLRARRRPAADVVRRGNWSTPAPTAPGADSDGPPPPPPR